MQQDVQEGALWHAVLISFRKDASPAVRHEIYSRYQTIAKECGGRAAGILLWKVEGNFDLRKGDHLLEIAVFESKEALEAFRAHPKHKELTDILREVADWRLGDIPCDASDFEGDEFKRTGPRHCSLGHIKGRVDIIDPDGEVPMYEIEEQGGYSWGCPHPLHTH